MKIEQTKTTCTEKSLGLKTASGETDDGAPKRAGNERRETEITELSIIR